MDENEFKMAWELITACGRMAQAVDIEDVEKLIRTADLAETLTPFTDPSAYLRGRDNLEDQKMLAGAFLVFRKAVEKISTRQKSR